MSKESAFYLLGRESGDVVSAVITALADKKIKLGEGVAIAKELAGVTMVTISHFNDIKKSFSDGLSEDECEEIREGFTEGFDIENQVNEDEIEEYFKLVMDMVRSTVALILKAAA